MHFGADMVGDETNDPLAVGSGHDAPAILQATRQPVDPQPAVRVQHHLDDRGVLEEGRDRRPERGAQHARASGKSLGMKWSDRHDRPRRRPIATYDWRRG